MPNVIQHAQRPHQVHHDVSWYLLVGLAVMLAIILILSMLPVISFPRTAVSPVALREIAYREYLQGEKAVIANPVAMNNAITAYHAGERVIYDTRLAVQIHNIGEKTATLDLNALNMEDALLLYRMGEKGLR